MLSNAYGKVPQSIGCFLKIPKSNKHNLYQKKLIFERAKRIPKESQRNKMCQRKPNRAKEASKIQPKGSQQKK
jgi:hypothetical protein